jgi:multidrug efflux pump subunit AcrB
MGKIDFSNWALNNRKLITFFILCLSIGGVLSFRQMPKLEDPELKVKQAMVVTTYPGASAHEVELEVTDKIEKSIREMRSISNIESQSMSDLSIITVELEKTLPDDEVEQEWDMLRRKVENASHSLPSGASEPIVRDDFGDVYGMFYCLTGDGLSNIEMSDYAELAKRNISDIGGVARCDIYGVKEECIYVDMHQEKMANLGVMPTEVIQTLNNQNKTAYSGYFNNGDNRIRIRVDDKFKTVDDISMMLIQGHDEEQLRIHDIAKVYKDYVKPTRNEMFRDGNPSLGISIACIGSYDVVQVGKQVDAVIKDLQSRMPVGVKFEKVFNQPERVNNAISTFLVNLAESVLIVIIVLIFTMGFKSGLIIGISLLTIVLGSLLVLKGFDGTLQRVSLGAFIIAMGMLVDNAIVIVDGILIDMHNGMPKREALCNIGRKTSMPLLGATLIAILAFWPIFLSPDSAGVYVRDLFIVIAVSLLLSWILALIHVPLMSDRMLRSPEEEQAAKDRKAAKRHLKSFKENVTESSDTETSESSQEISSTDNSTPDETSKDNSQPSTPSNPYHGFTYRLLEKILRTGIRFRYIAICIAIGLLGLCAWAYQYLNQAFFPDMEYDQLYMEYKLPEGVNSTQVNKDLTEIEALLKKNKNITHITRSIGGTPSRYNLVRSIATPSLSYGELIIDFTSPTTLVSEMDSLQTMLNQLYPDAYIKFKRYNLMFKKYPIEACFHGPDPSVLHVLCDSALSIIRNSKSCYLPTSDWSPQVPVLNIKYDQSNARISGLSRSDVAMSVMAYTGGIPIGTFYDGINKKSIYLKCTDNDGNDISRLENIVVFGLIPNLHKVINRSMVQKLITGTLRKDELIEALTQSTPLRQVAKGIDIVWEEPVVMRYNGQRSIRAQCSPVPGVGTEAARQDIAKKIEAIELPAGYSLSWEGEKRASDDSMKYLFANFPLAILLMIIILIILFKDYKKPLIIFCCVPLIVIGVIPTILLTGKPFGFVAIIGVLGLIGMMIKNGIVLMDEINLLIKNGVTPLHAVIESSKSRLRPVMMASLTTILGMIPLIPDALFGSLAVTIMGGLFMGTIITLIFIPILYATFFGLKSQDKEIDELYEQIEEEEVKE